MFKLGISSSTLPKNISKELRGYLELYNLDQVDLRINKGQKWEEDGLSQFEKEEVAFLGTDIILGDPYWDIEEINRTLKNYNGFHIRVFASSSALLEREFLLKQINTLKNICGEARKILVETHEGYGSPIEIKELASRYNVNVLLDNLGLFKISNNPEGDIKLLKPFISHIQVKGFNKHNPLNSIHLPIRHCDLSFLNIFAGKDITVLLETKNNSFSNDLDMLINYTKKMEGYEI